MELFLQRLFDSLGNGAIYASMGVAFTLVYRSSGLLNFAQGEMAMFSTYFALMLSSPPTPFRKGSGVVALIPGTPWPLWAALLGTVVVSMAFGAGIERTLIRGVMDRDDTAIVSITFGLLLLMQVVAATQWAGGVYPSLFPSGVGQHFRIGGAHLDYETVGTWALLGGVLGLVYLFMRFTRSGLAFRAISSNRSSAELCGIRVGAQLMTGWAIAAAIGAVAGSVVAAQSRLSPGLMVGVLVYSLAGATLGGLDSPIGAAIGGFVVAIAQTMLQGYTSFVSGDIGVVAAATVLLLVLVFRPQGMFGRKRATSL